MEHISAPLSRVLIQLGSFDPSALFLADKLSSEAGDLFVRAVTAGENGRFAEQRGLVAEAAGKLAEALAVINPATPDNDPTPAAAALRAA